MPLSPFFSRFWSRRVSSTPHAGRALLFIATLATLCAFVTQSVLFLLDARFYDIGISGRSAQQPDDVVIVGLDEKFMADRHPYLAPRDRLAKLLNTIAIGHPGVVVLDVFLDSRIDKTPNGQDEQLRCALSNVKASGAKILISDLSPGQMSGDEDDSSQTGSTAHGSALSFFRDATTASGSVVFKTDADGVVRRLPSYSQQSLEPMPLLAARLYEPYRANLSNRRTWENLQTRLQHDNVPIRFSGPPGTIAQIPAVQLLEQPLIAPILARKLVFIGSTYERGHDVVRTPYTMRRDHPQWKSMYGVELLAQTTNALLTPPVPASGDTPEARFFLLLRTFCFSLIVTFLAMRGTGRGIFASLLALSGSGAIAIASARDVTSLWGFRFHPAAQIWIAVPIACAAAIAWRQWQEARELQHVRGAFEAYVGPQVLKQLGNKMPELGGEVRPVTVLFCDIRGYSALAETMRDDPEGLLSELNGHFSPLVGALQAKHAHVDNYVGDLIMALWCEPLSGRSPEQNARDAVAAALEIERVVNERNRERIKKGLPPIEVGIGLHCGEAVVGNLGGQSGKDSKIHYTAIGDTVNLASRVESSTRQFNLPLLVTGAIVEQCGEDSGYGWEFIARTQVKGRQEMVDVFRIIPNAEEEQFSLKSGQLS